MNYVDGLLLIPLAYAAFRGFKNGLIKEVLGIAGLVIAVLLGFNLITPASHFLTQQWDLQGETVPYLAFGMVFFATLIAISVLTYILDTVIKLVFLSIPNRVFGGIFSTLKMGILLSLALIFLSGFNLPNQEVKEESIAYTYVIGIAPAAYDALAIILPGISNYKDTVGKTIEEYNPLININI